MFSLGSAPFVLLLCCFGDETQVWLGDLRVVLVWFVCCVICVMICHLMVSANCAAYRFFTAYVVIRTVPQSIYGQTREKKMCVGLFFVGLVVLVWLPFFLFSPWNGSIITCTTNQEAFLTLASPTVINSARKHLHNDLARAIKALEQKKSESYRGVGAKKRDGKGRKKWVSKESIDLYAVQAFFCSNALIALARSLCTCLLAQLITASGANAVKGYLVRCACIDGTIP